LAASISDQSKNNNLLPMTLLSHPLLKHGKASYSSEPVKFKTLAENGISR
jgi:hypothetical protein